MKLSWGDKDGGPESHVRVWGLEFKRFATVYLIKFDRGSREAYHTHAFNSISWLLSGGLTEKHFGGAIDFHTPGWRPIRTWEHTFHKVEGVRASNWAITFRGPWVSTWREFLPREFRFRKLTHGRIEV